MKISIIVAMSDNHVIGYQGKLPWHLSADLKHFKALTLGKALIMGRKTFESIGRPLPGRQTIIVTRNQQYQIPGCLTAHSLDASLTLAKRIETDYPEVMIAGGGELYAQALDIANCLYITRIHTTIEGDTYFPHWPATEWKETQREAHAAKDDQPAYTFLTFVRRL